MLGAFRFGAARGVGGGGWLPQTHLDMTGYATIALMWINWR